MCWDGKFIFLLSIDSSFIVKKRKLAHNSDFWVAKHDSITKHDNWVRVFSHETLFKDPSKVLESETVLSPMKHVWSPT